MARFYFDLTKDDRTTTDFEGTELADNRLLHREAFEYLGEIARDRLRRSLPGQLTLHVMDSDRTSLMTAKLSLEVEGSLL